MTHAATHSAAAVARRTQRTSPPSVTNPEAGITIYGCEPDEADLFRVMARRHGVSPTITAAPLTDANAGLASGHRCISIGHKTLVKNSALLALSQTGVSYVSTRSIGCNHIDTDYAERLGISVETVEYSPDSVADYTLMLMLMVVRHAYAVIRAADAHDYRLNDARGRELRDLTVGVIGAGRIGGAVIERLRAFGGRTLAHDLRPTGAGGHVTLDELLERSDIVTLHTPLTAVTHHLLDRHRIERMKRGAVIINTGRGPLLDTAALVSALERGRLGGAALDVLEGEEGIFYADYRRRPIKSQLLLRLQQMPNVLISPHTAYYTDHALRDTVEQSLFNCVNFERRTRHG
jgi:D-specific alpha-keto acid dehydrogenase